MECTWSVPVIRLEEEVKFLSVCIDKTDVQAVLLQSCLIYGDQLPVEEGMPMELADPRRRVVGLKQTLKAIRSGRVKLVYVTLDAQQEMTEQVRAEAVLRGIPVETVSSMEALGKACRIQAKAAAAAELKDVT